MPYRIIAGHCQELDISNDELAKNFKELLNADADLGFLLVLEKRDMEKLVACIRGRLNQASEKGKRRKLK